MKKFTSPNKENTNQIGGTFEFHNHEKGSNSFMMKSVQNELEFIPVSTILDRYTCTKK